MAPASSPLSPRSKLPDAAAAPAGEKARKSRPSVAEIDVVEANLTNDARVERD